MTRRLRKNNLRRSRRIHKEALLNGREEESPIKLPQAKKDEMSKLEKLADKHRRQRARFTPEETDPVRKGRLKSKAYDVFKIQSWPKKMTKAFSEGASLEEVLMMLGLTKKMHRFLIDRAESAKRQDIREKCAEYRKTVNHGLELAEAWWMKLGRQGVHMGKFFNTALFAQNMRNRYGWSDKQGGSESEESLRSIQQSMAKIAGLGKEVKPTEETPRTRMPVKIEKGIMVPTKEVNDA